MDHSERREVSRVVFQAAVEQFNDTVIDEWIANHEEDCEALVVRVVMNELQLSGYFEDVEALAVQARESRHNLSRKLFPE